MNCADSNHRADIVHFNECIINALKGGENCFERQPTVNTWNVPGWNDYVAEKYQHSRDLRQIWLQNGKPRGNWLHSMYLKAKADFKYTLRSVKRNERMLREDSMANKLLNSSNDSKPFWKEVRNINNSKLPLPTCIDGVAGEDNIVLLWKEHYSSILSSISRHTLLNNVQNCDDSHSDLKIEPEEVIRAIRHLKLGKSGGADTLFPENVVYAHESLNVVLAIFFH